MVQIVKLLPEHLVALKASGAVGRLGELVGDRFVKLADFPQSWAAVSGERVIAVAGVLDYWPGRGEMWAIFNKPTPLEFFQIHRAAKRFIECLPHKRLEATVECDFKAGHRWIQQLGFHLEAEKLKFYGIGGVHMSMYAKIKTEDT